MGFWFVVIPWMVTLLASLHQATEDCHFDVQIPMFPKGTRRAFGLHDW